MDKLKQIQDKISEFQAKSAAKEEIKALVTLVLSVLKASKESFDNLTKENLATIQQAIQYIEQEHNKVINSVSQETKEAKLDFAKQVKELKDLISKVKTIKPIDGQDGYTPVKGEDYFTETDKKELVDKVLKEIPEDEEETGEEIVKKINDLEIKPELQIDAKHIKNLPEQVVYRGGGVSGDRKSVV